jgi:2'-5' RNA ligase
MVAIIPPDEIAAEVMRFKQAYEERPSIPHLTLVRPFLFNVNEKVIIQTLKKALADFELFDVEPGRQEKIGAFNNGDNFVVYYGVERTVPLVNVQRAINNCLTTIVDFMGKKYDFNPHITIRNEVIWGGSDLVKISEEAASIRKKLTIPSFKCSSIHLLKKDPASSDDWQLSYSFDLKSS